MGANILGQIAKLRVLPRQRLLDVWREGLPKSCSARDQKGAASSLPRLQDAGKRLRRP